MIEVFNVNIDDEHISMDCIGDGDEAKRYHIVLDREFNPLPCVELNAHTQRAIALARRYYEREGTIPAEFKSVWY